MTELRPFDLTDFDTLTGWFPNEHAVFQWAGPSGGFPLRHEHLQLASCHSFSLWHNQQLVGFGQFYLRHQRAHMARLAIAPHARGQGLIQALLNGLEQTAQQTLAHHGFSLFVLADNTPARQAYERAGYSYADYPDVMPLENCLYMLKVAN